MKIFTLLVTIGALCFCGEIKTAAFNVNGMFCSNGCVKKIKTIVGSIEGVQKCNVDYNTSSMTVQFDSEKVNNDQIIAELTKSTSYKYSDKSAQCTKCTDSNCVCNQNNVKTEKKKTFFSKIFGW